MNAWLIDVIEAYVGSKAEHEDALNHVGTNHTAGSDDKEFVVC